MSGGLNAIRIAVTGVACIALAIVLGLALAEFVRVML
jgi:hypothetical protein